ncbi:TetR/AcrR family transcriptional regulator [Nocardia colli]|nr:TetR/AcrR family transcriptional regulator [Nocardia colli]
MVYAATELLQRRGVAAMSFTEVLAASGAARGAIYHHFPGGKRQLVAEAAERHGTVVRDHLAALSGDSPQEVVATFLATVRPVVGASVSGHGCAIAAVAIDPDPEDDRLRHTAATAFTSWEDALASRLTAAGMSVDDANSLAALLIATLEGAHITCRAANSLTPFDRAEKALLRMVRDVSCPD